VRLPQLLLLLAVGVVLDLGDPVWTIAVETRVVTILADVFLATDERPTVAAWNTTRAARAS
jgi:hypothetical protein